MSALPEQPQFIESVQLSRDGNSLRVVVADTDPEVVAFASAGGFGPSPVSGFKKYMRLAVIAATVGTYQTGLADLMEAERQAATLRELPQAIGVQVGAEITAQIARLVGDGERPSNLAAAEGEFIKEFTEQLSSALAPVIDKLTGGDAAALPQMLEQRVVTVVQREASALLKRVFATDGTSPLMMHLDNDAKAVAALRAEMTAMESRLQAVIAEATKLIAVQAAVTPAPADVGRDWESAVIADVGRVTSILGDVVEQTGSTPSHAGSKKGDAVLCVADEGVSGLRVGLECRTGTSKNGRVTIKNLLAAVANRDAHAGLLLVDRPELLPRDAEADGFRCYWRHRLVVLCYDRTQPHADRDLATAVQVARLLARAAVSSEGQLAEREELGAVCSVIEGGLSRLRSLRGSATGIKKDADKITSCVIELEVLLRDALSTLARLAQGR